MTAPIIVEREGRKFQMKQTIASDSCRECDVLGTSLCDKMPDCAVIDGEDILFYTFKEVKP